MATDETKVVKRIKAKTNDQAKKTAREVKVKVKDNDNAKGKTKVKSKTTKKPTKDIKSKKQSQKEDTKNYFVGAWRELRQVHWTNRRATWTLTIAVILFSGFFALFILVADWIWNWLMQEVIL
ncbi:preprotein translocase subunit SecE [Candidatus Saccharibacteria bacterium]|nr:preprotein translocase subunit SecE [Candidatus Saccharibacteria bacterium]